MAPTIWDLGLRLCPEPISALRAHLHIALRERSNERSCWMVPDIGRDGVLADAAVLARSLMHNWVMVNVGFILHIARHCAQAEPGRPCADPSRHAKPPAMEEQ